MPFPDLPQKATSYTARAQALGDGSLPGRELDVDISALVRHAAALHDFLGQIVRSDGRLNNAIVGRENLAPSLLLGFDAPSVWAPGVAYSGANTVFVGSAFYLLLEEHTASANFADDLDAGRWELLVDLNSAGALVAGNNLSDLPSKALARENLGLNRALLGTLNLSDVVNVAAARANLGLTSAGVAAANAPVASDARALTLRNGVYSVVGTTANVPGPPKAGLLFVSGHASGQRIHRYVSLDGLEDYVLRHDGTSWSETAAAAPSRDFFDARIGSGTGAPNLVALSGNRGITRSSNGKGCVIDTAGLYRVQWTVMSDSTSICNCELFVDDSGTGRFARATATETGSQEVTREFAAGSYLRLGVTGGGVVENSGYTSFSVVQL